MDFHERFKRAFVTRDVAEFMSLIFPETWAPIAARILESGVTMAKEMVPWAPRWSEISPTVRGDESNVVDMWVRSALYRAHDCLHQLWGLPIPSPDLSIHDFFILKRSQMCGEMTVLLLTEFVLGKHLWDHFPEAKPTLLHRDAIPMLLGPLKGRTTREIVMRLDGLLHKRAFPEWMRNDLASLSFVKYYRPMLELDRRCIDHNWGLMKAAAWRPVGAPNARYNSELDGLELTLWMVDDFFHLRSTDHEVDHPLRVFNFERRRSIELPKGWNEPPNEMQLHAACMVVRDSLVGQILLAERKEKPGDWGLLGGSIKPGEDAEDAAIRETFEEGRILVKRCREVYRADGVVTFEALEWVSSTGIGDVRTKWGTWEEAIVGTFGDYNSSVYEVMGP